MCFSSVFSFDIFDTCLVRKCGTPRNMLDVLSLRVFDYPVEEWVRQEFVVARRKAETQQFESNPKSTIEDIYDNLDFHHCALMKKSQLVNVEIELERELLVPVLKMRERIDRLREKGHHIIYISDMYLPESFLRPIMQFHGFLKEGDSLYVSCEIGCQKRDGSLFEYVKEREGLKYVDWKHVGDNRFCDYNVPRKLGIRTELVSHGYNPYPRQWMDNDYSLMVKYPSILAGLSRALSLSNPDNTHRDFILDIIAPFYSSWLYRIFEDAQKRGINRLYFCARDAYQIHKMALHMQVMFPNIGVEYVYISRHALYEEKNEEAKLAYFKQIGLASENEKVAIVDTTTSGKTLHYLNVFLTNHGYKELFGYFFLLWNKVEGTDRLKSDVKIFDAYLKENPVYDRLLPFFLIFENYFGVNNEERTDNYAFEKGKAIPVFTTELMKEDCIIRDDKDWASVHQQLLCQYVESFVQIGLYRYSSIIFDGISVPNMCRFFTFPEKSYLSALENFYCLLHSNGVMIPCIRKIHNPINLVRLFLSDKKNCYWRRASIIYSSPNWLLKLIKLMYDR